VGQSDDNGATVLAGVNSSRAEQLAGRNQHLRTFGIVYPPSQRKGNHHEDSKEHGAGGPSGEWQPTDAKMLAKVSLFTPDSDPEPNKEPYQRILRLSPHADARLGAVATGLAKAGGEVVIFDASKATPSQGDVRKRIKPGHEAADIDIIHAEDGSFLVAYCTDYAVFICSVPRHVSPKTKEPVLLHANPRPDASSGRPRPKFRCLRFLTPALLLILQNIPVQSGAELLLLKIPSPPHTLGDVILRRPLHKSIKSATAMATALLPTPTPSQNVQHVIAVAGQDISLTILTIDHPPDPTGNLSLRKYSVLHAVHPLQMTAVSFSTFEPPPPDHSEASEQFLKLASVSMSSTVVVHTLPLTPYQPSTQKNARQPVRHTLQPPLSRVEALQASISVILSVIAVAAIAFLLQAFIEIRGGTPEYLGAKGWLSQRVHDAIAKPYMFDEVPPITTTNSPKPHDWAAAGPRAERVV
jgi:hypothetical protein